MMNMLGRRFWLLSLPLIAVVLMAGFLLWFRDDSPPFDHSWPVAEPASQGMDRAALQALDQELAERGTDAWLVVRNGKIVHEWYRQPDVNRRFGAASMSKALVGGLGLMLAADRGLLHWDQPASTYVDTWRDEPKREAVTLLQLANHSSGLAHPAEPDQAGDDAALWETRFWERHDDLIHHVEEDVPLLFEPGTDYGYSGPAYAILSRALAESMRGSEWRDLKSFLDEELMTPLELHPKSWSIGYGDDVFSVDGLDLYATWGGASFTLRATARIGLLLLERGAWNGRQLLSENVVRQATVYAETGTIPPSIQTGEQLAPALGWWSNEFGTLKSLPQDAFLAAGAGHRILVVVPSLDLVIVRYGTRMGDDHWDGDFWQVLDEVLLAPVIEAAKGERQTAALADRR
jgi:CubicO group peptidase (beta-lactamase class C family)